MSRPTFMQLVPEATGWPNRRATGKQPVTPLRQAAKQTSALGGGQSTVDTVALYAEEVRAQLWLRAEETLQHREQRNTYFTIINIPGGVDALQKHSGLVYAIGQCAVILEENGYSDEDLSAWVKDRPAWPGPQFGLPDRIAGQIVEVLHAAAEHYGLELDTETALQARFASAVTTHERASTNELGLSRTL